MVGKDDPGVDAEGRVEPYLPKSVPQHVNCVTNRSERRSSKLTVKNDPPGTRLRR